MNPLAAPSVKLHLQTLFAQTDSLTKSRFLAMIARSARGGHQGQIRLRFALMTKKYAYVTRQTAK